MPKEDWRISIDARTGEWNVFTALEVSKLPIKTAIVLYRNTLIALTEIISSMWKDIETFKDADDLIKIPGKTVH